MDALAFYLRLSRQYESQTKNLLEVLPVQTRKLLQGHGKLVKGSGWSVDGGLVGRRYRNWY